jgi:hypothetical protein
MGGDVYMSCVHGGSQYKLFAIADYNKAHPPSMMGGGTLLKMKH